MSFALRHNILSQVHKFVHSAQNIFKLLDPDNQKLMLDNPVEIQEQSAPEKDECKGKPWWLQSRLRYENSLKLASQCLRTQI